jgi:hypothetical protein
MKLPAVAIAFAFAGGILLGLSGWVSGKATASSDICRHFPACLACDSSATDRTVLLPGYAEKQVEYQMLSENEEAFLHADVLRLSITEVRIQRCRNF